jgi:hypothetical protein
MTSYYDANFSFAADYITDCLNDILRNYSVIQRFRVEDLVNCAIQVVEEPDRMSYHSVVTGDRVETIGRTESALCITYALHSNLYPEEKIYLNEDIKFMEVDNQIGLVTFQFSSEVTEKVLRALKFYNIDQNIKSKSRKKAIPQININLYML